MRVIAAMSGGVDSAVAAARAVEAGHEVVGVHLALARKSGTLRTGSRGCCTIEDANDARRAAAKLEIPFFVWDFSERFQQTVIADFKSEYQAGRTPNPCMRCNEYIKFEAVLERALALGFDAVCTGHYAEIRETEHGLELHRSAESAKDQSYVLSVLTQDQLRHAMFPLGTTASKAAVRAEADRRGLSVANKPDSYDICFIPEGDTRDWLAEFVGSEPGKIVTESGEEVGRHDGYAGFTVGQRRGLALGRPAPNGERRFVLEIRPKTAEVVVGPQQQLAVKQIAGTSFTWCGAPPKVPLAGLDVEVQIRAHAEAVPAKLLLTQDELQLDLPEPIFGVAPGQTAAIYLGTRVLGQTTIERTTSLEEQLA